MQKLFAARLTAMETIGSRAINPPEGMPMRSSRLRITLALLPLFAALATFGQTSQPVIEDFKPSPLNQAGAQYPQVNSEGRARFRVMAPQAQSVKSSFRGENHVERAADGAWLVTTR